MKNRKKTWRMHDRKRRWKRGEERKEGRGKRMNKRKFKIKEEGRRR